VPRAFDPGVRFHAALLARWHPIRPTGTTRPVWRRSGTARTARAPDGATRLIFRFSVDDDAPPWGESEIHTHRIFTGWLLKVWVEDSPRDAWHFSLVVDREGDREPAGPAREIGETGANNPVDLPPARSVRFREEDGALLVEEPAGSNRVEGALFLLPGGGMLAFVLQETMRKSFDSPFLAFFGVLLLGIGIAALMRSSAARIADGEIRVTVHCIGWRISHRRVAASEVSGFKVRFLGGDVNESRALYSVVAQTAGSALSLVPGLTNPRQAEAFRSLVQLYFEHGGGFRRSSDRPKYDADVGILLDLISEPQRRARALQEGG
jgi:hypothetical protein